MGPGVFLRAPTWAGRNPVPTGECCGTGEPLRWLNSGLSAV